MRERLTGSALFFLAALAVVGCLALSPVGPFEWNRLQFFILVAPAPLCAAFMGAIYGRALSSSVQPAVGYMRATNIGIRVAFWSWAIYAVIASLPSLNTAPDAESSWTDQLIRSLSWVIGLSVIMIPVLCTVGALTALAYVWTARRLTR